MKRFSLFASVIVLGMGTVSLLPGDRHNPYVSTRDDVVQNANGAFRDGLYLGRLAGKSGLAPAIARGRWSSTEDQASFSAGYRRGYNEFVAVGNGSDKRDRLAE